MREMKRPCSDCPFAQTIEAARRRLAVQLMDARAALTKMQRALAVADDAYGDLIDVTESLRPERD